MSVDPITFSDEELSDLLRDASVAPASIVREMQEAGAEPLPVDAIASTRTMLGDIGQAEPDAIVGLPERLRGLVLDEVQTKKAAGIVAGLLASRDKGIVKEAKRIQHHLKQQGVSVEAPSKAAPETKSAAITHASTPEEIPTYLSSADGTGSRIAILARSVRGGIDVAQVVVSDVSGVVDARLAPLARKEFRKFIQNLSMSGEVVLGEVPRAYARGLITTALDLNAKARRPIPSSWHEVAFAIGPSTPAQASPGRTLALPDDLADAAMRASELLLLPELRSWVPEREILDSVERQLASLTNSPLEIDPSSRQASLRSAISAAVHEYWTANRRHLMAERLFDLAWLLHGQGRAEQSAMASASGAWLDSDRPVENVPFAFAFFESPLMAWVEKRRGSSVDAGSGLVASP